MYACTSVQLLVVPFNQRQADPHCSTSDHREDGPTPLSAPHYPATSQHPHDMKLTGSSLAAAALLFGLSLPLSVVVDGFSSSTTRTHHRSTTMSTTLAAATGVPGESDDDGSDSTEAPPPKMAASRRQQKMSRALPFLRCPPVLAQCEYAGNVGFDPLGLAKNLDQLAEMRESEIKHARIAMLVRYRT